MNPISVTLTECEFTFEGPGLVRPQTIKYRWTFFTNNLLFKMLFHLFLLMTSAMWNLEKWSATFTSLCRVWMVNGNWWPCSTHGSLETSWALVLFTSVTKIIFSLWTINFENCLYRSRLWNGFLGLAPRLRNIIFTPAYFLFHYFTYMSWTKDFDLYRVWVKSVWEKIQKWLEQTINLVFAYLNVLLFPFFILLAYFLYLHFILQLHCFNKISL